MSYMKDVNTIQTNGVPDTYSKQTQNSDQFNIVKGTLNKLRLRPQIQNEYCESSREGMYAITSANVVGQIFKASQDNINGISLTLQSNAIFASMNNITSGSGEHKSGTMEYSSDGALQAEYIKSGSTEAVRGTFTDAALVTQDGSYACKMPMDVDNDDWRVGLSATDLTGVTFSLKYANTKEWNRAKMYFFIGDGTNTKSYPLTIALKNVWQTFKFAESDMIVHADDDTSTTPTITAITQMGFRVTDPDGAEFAYVDSITYQVEGGSIKAELWDMGSSLPASDGTVDYTTGTQYTELGDKGIAGFVTSSIDIDLVGGKRKYHIDELIAGVALEKPSNTLLTVDNYYALILKYVDTDVLVYGPNTTYSVNYYTNGYAWKAETSDNLIDVIPGVSGSGAYSDLMFQIFSTQDVYIHKFQLFTTDAPSGNADVSVFSEDKNMGIVDIPVSNQKGGMGRTEITMDLSLKPSLLEKGGKFEAYYNDDPTDDVDVVLFAMDYLFIPPTTNG